MKKLNTHLSAYLPAKSFMSTTSIGVSVGLNPDNIGFGDLPPAD